MTTITHCDGRDESGCPHDATTTQRLTWGWTVIYDRKASGFAHRCPRCTGHTDEAIAKAKRKR